MNVRQSASAPPAPTPIAPRPQLFRLSSFDRMVLLVILLLLAGVGLTILLGDRVGVTLERVGPLGTARATSRITLQFSESMNRDTVTPRLRLVQVDSSKLADGAFSEQAVLATIPGETSWNGSTLSFRPAQALSPGANYMVILQAGATSETGRQVLSEYQFSFTVRRPRVAFLAPASGSPLNIWIADPADPQSAQQVTFSPSGIFDFGVSPDGTKIAFSERNSNTGTSDIKLLDLETGGIQQLTNCQDADCTTPVWRPDGQVIAYERVEFNSDFTQVGVSPTRIWVIDLSSTPATTRPMFSDSQILGYGLQWSADGSRVSQFDINSQGILVHDFSDNSTVIIPSRYGSTGSLSPDGNRLVFPEVLLTEAAARSYLQLVDIRQQKIEPLSNPDDPVDDDAAVWSPDGQYLAIARRYTDDRYTRGRQLYLYNPADDNLKPLVVDPRYANGIFAWDATGTQIVLQRFPELTASGEVNSTGTPEIWTVEVGTGALVQVAVDAFFPRWVP